VAALSSDSGSSSRSQALSALSHVLQSFASEEAAEGEAASVSHARADVLMLLSPARTPSDEVGAAPSDLAVYQRTSALVAAGRFWRCLGAALCGIRSSTDGLLLSCFPAFGRRVQRQEVANPQARTALLRDLVGGTPTLDQLSASARLLSLWGSAEPPNGGGEYGVPDRRTEWVARAIEAAGGSGDAADVGADDPYGEGWQVVIEAGVRTGEWGFVGSAVVMAGGRGEGDERLLSIVEQAGGTEELVLKVRLFTIGISLITPC
jgi:hypothetical protein